MQANKQIVLDANILIRAVLGKKVRQTLEKYVDSTQFLTPEICYQDAQKYLPSLFEKRGLIVQPALDLLEKLNSLVIRVEESLYSAYEQDARQRIAMRDADDWPIVALALALNCPICTEDTDFFGSGLPTWTSDRIHLFLSL